MKRDMDLVRGMLLAIEDDVLRFGEGTDNGGLDAPDDVITAHLRLLEQAGLIEVMSRPISGPIYIRGLTWDGHDFLDAVRDPEVWKRTKDGALTVGGWTFGLMKELGVAYLKQVAKERLHLDL